ncbi:superoxide dismutase family protein (plasmid) [Paroceanicella profunda]|uniref:Superoxide dismutase [Cu-Zn] n=1 Tax=Paroceanicella profunda TaxID=2579971 RepID=A0A5B8G4F3_9RHOB|nr:superoxide dismutase family protein [Paroceanicella profunda]QDL93803.1 superoxide dismutase family protein [Paroceanicella profunda]
MNRRCLALIASGALAGLAAVPAAAADATAKFVTADGSDAGSAELTATGSGVLISAEVTGLPADSWVAFHIHETGTCDPATGFKSAGGHFNPLGAQHGLLAEGGPHAGDMPNQYVGADGVLHAQVLDPFVTLVDGDTDVRGLAIVIHDGTDDYVSQPSGDAGNRIACAVIE